MKITKSRLKKAIREVLEEIEEEMIKDTPRSQIRKDPEPELSEEVELDEEEMPEDVLAIKKAINKKRLRKDAEDAKKAKKES